ncbi:unnamed protein product [Camellia sinensis]
MYPFLSKAHGLHTKSLSFYSNLIDHCLSLKSSDFSKFIHAHLIKVGFNRHTFLGNRCIDMYSKVGTLSDALQAFDDIANKNIISWNICLRVFVKSCNLEGARNMFDKMPERDVVSWNSLISGYASNGYFDNALELFKGMQNDGMRPNEFTFSILVSYVTSAYRGKQIHGIMIRSGVNLSNVVGNSLIGMYGTLGVVDYAFGVFLTMEEVDVITWNSLISGCYKSGHGEFALKHFCLMVSVGYAPDEFTISTVITVCNTLRDLEKGKQIFAFCIKVGFLSNSIVSSAAIDLFSKCNRLEDSIQLFEEINLWDSVVCNSMISSYARHGGFGEDALRFFVLTLRDSLRPTEFTISSVLSSASSLLPAEQGSQLHSLVVKLGMESDAVVASSLVEMYAKFGLIDTSMKIFAQINLKDLITWNTIILGLVQNGREAETLELFKALLKRGPPPDRITLTGVLLACNYGGLVDEGLRVFSSMEKAYGVIPRDEHYLCIVDMMSRAGKLKEAMDIIGTMPHQPSSLIWESILRGCGADGDFKLTERVAEWLIEYDPQSSLPYLVLARSYEMRGRWESMVRVKNAMKESNVKKMIGCCLIGIRNHVFVFKENHILHYEDKNIYLILRLLNCEMGIEGSVHDQYENVSAEGEQDQSRKLLKISTFGAKKLEGAIANFKMEIFNLEMDFRSV